MTEYRVDPMKPDDYAEALVGIPHDLLDPLENGHAYVKLGPAFTARIDGRIAAVAGVLFPWRELGKVWAVWTPAGRETFGARRFVHRAVLSTLRQIVAARRPLRLEAEVVVGFPAGQRWAESLGLRPEFTVDGQPAVRKARGLGGRDMIPYVWLAEEARRG